MPKITKNDIAKLEPSDQLTFLWDSTLPGFGVRCTGTGVKSYVLRYRFNGKQRIKTLGRVEIIDLTQARETAREKLYEATTGADPFSKTADINTLKDLSEVFQTKRKGELKPKTLQDYKSLWKHIIEIMGHMNVEELDEDDVQKLRKFLEKTPTSFNRSINLIVCALKWHGVPVETHPFKRAKKFKEHKRERILSQKENTDFYAILGEYRRKRKTGWRYADLFILLLLTGMRRDEWRCGRWEWVDFETCKYNLPDNKTGGRVVDLSDIALTVLKDMHTAQKTPAKGFIFPSPTGNKKIPMSWTWRIWNQMRNEVGLQGFRIHDMRHTAGSFAHAYGNLTQRQVADFLGHKRIETSSRYIHDNHKKESADIAAEAIAQGWKND